MTRFIATKPTIIYNADGKQVTLSPSEATQFDKSTIKRSKEFGQNYDSRSMALLGFEAGRYSTRGSMRLLAKALEKEECSCGHETGSESAHAEAICSRCEALNRVHANGDYPLTAKEEEEKA